MAPKRAREDRKTKKTRASRGAPVVEGVLRATIEEIGRVGYRALRIEDVAARAGVHKTTIYRRFPTKPDLVQATIQSAFDENLILPDTGSLRGDLLVVARRALDFALSATGQAVVRMVMTESTEDEVRTIVDSVVDAKEVVPRRILESALARGELRTNVDGRLLITTIVGSLHHAVFALGRVPSERDVEALVDLLLYGAASATAAERDRPRARHAKAGKPRPKACGMATDKQAR